ncbi:signal peptidase I W [Oxobacter pfennigii]|uniref:Signal peptidase I n=1 Tax=Oxobacter pfennigii TaxID=36849 RepID=A0A0P8Z1A8_9CLOT|nr:signal peptidase I W [Oxobacter pfennigii]
MQTKFTTQEQIEAMRKEIMAEKERQSGRGGKRSPGRNKLVFKIFGWIAFLSVVLSLTTAIVYVNIAKTRGEIPGILGFHLFVVESGSMEPTFNIGSVILCRKAKNPDNLKTNDVVTFKNLSGYIVTHRIVEVVTDENRGIAYRTKGDNPRNSTDRELLTPDRVLAVFIGKIPLT